DTGGGGAKAGGGTAPEGGTRRKPKTQKPRRLSYREQRELESLPDRIAELEAEQAEIHERLQDPAVYRSDAAAGEARRQAGHDAGTEDAGGDTGAAVRELTERLAVLDKEIADAYRRWESLESSL
ncbi:MAG: hypothetical protein GVY23_03575, partial [Spirochaetes bacterium]|nr:hypothetical protein [Spirochaetota bacterium]